RGLPAGRWAAWPDRSAARTDRRSCSCRPRPGRRDREMHDLVLRIALGERDRDVTCARLRRPHDHGRTRAGERRAERPRRQIRSDLGELWGVLAAIRLLPPGRPPPSDDPPPPPPPPPSPPPPPPPP